MPVMVKPCFRHPVGSAGQDIRNFLARNNMLKIQETEMSR